MTQCLVNKYMLAYTSSPRVEALVMTQCSSVNCDFDKVEGQPCTVCSHDQLSKSRRLISGCCSQRLNTVDLK